MSNPLFFMPTRAQVEALKVGDLAPDYAGRMLPVVEITARHDDIHGKLFACYYTASPSGNGSSSNAIKEDELLLTIPVSAAYTWEQLQRIERDMQRQRRTA